MRKPAALIALALALLVSACETTPPAPPPDPRAPRAEGQMCGGIAGFQCRPGLQCVIAPPMFPDKSGVCTAPRQVCPMIYKPVCGKDGSTYPNACHAARAGVAVAHEGGC